MVACLEWWEWDLLYKISESLDHEGKREKRWCQPVIYMRNAKMVINIIRKCLIPNLEIK